MEMNSSEKRKILFIGLELGVNSAVVSYYISGMEEVVTIPSIRGEGNYTIPTAICTTMRGNTYCGEEAVNRRFHDNVKYYDHLLEGALNGDQIEKENLIAYLDWLLDFRFSLLKENMEWRLAVTIPAVSKKAVKVLNTIRTYFSLTNDQFRISEYSESFFDYAHHKGNAIWISESVIFELTENRLLMRAFKIGTPQSPRSVVSIGKSWEVSEDLLQDNEKKDQNFSAILQKVLECRKISNIFLIGDGFHPKWMKKTLETVGEERKVFIGKNLYSKGACMGLYQASLARISTYIFECHYKVISRLCIRLKKDREEQLFPLTNPNGCWFIGGYQYTLLFDGTPELDIYSISSTGETKLVQTLKMADFPDKRKKSIRLKLKAYCIDEATLSIDIEDDGFGNFYESTEKQWNFQIKMERE